jgi:hypothetical protein
MCLELIYTKEDHQVSIYASIIASTPQHRPPSSPASNPPPPPADDLPFPPNAPEQHQIHIHGRRRVHEGAA